MVAPVRPVVDVQPPVRRSNQLAPGRRFEWPTDPEQNRTPTKAEPTEANGTEDKVGAAIAVTVVVAFVAFIFWVITHGTPVGYDPTWDYWMY